MKISSLRLLAVGAVVAANAIVFASSDIGISASAFAPCDQYGVRTGPWVNLETESQPSVQAPSWATGYDGMCVNLALLDATQLFTSIYGPAPGARIAFNVGTTGMVVSATAPPATNFFNAPFAIQDVVPAPGARGRRAHRGAFNWHWNPLGTFPTRTGAAPCRIIYRSYDQQGNYLSGVIFTFVTTTGIDSLNAGSYNGWSIPTSARDVGIEMPYNGILTVAIGTVDGLGNFAQLPAPGQASVRFYPWCAPNDPYMPGTNPSSTQPGFFLDDSRVATGDYFPSTTNPVLNNPDFVITASEEVPATGANAYIFNSPLVPSTRQLEPAMMLAVDTNAVYFEGTVNFLDLDPSTLRPITSATFEIRDNDNADALVDTRTVALGPNGEFAVLAKVDVDTVSPFTGTVRNGNFNIWVKQTHWLGKKIGPISMTGSSVTGLVINCLNGDANDDNVVDIGDFAILSTAYGSDPSSGNWNIDADFNHDDAVDIADYAILSSNYGAEGDE
ncbi:MAG: hypothetical protein K1X67_08655 [Fimbriimonadaceae bacterium]|nr:hypothetical protein [Fimbriimonadaceae bacterium]